jgi:cytochrome c553
MELSEQRAADMKRHADLLARHALAAIAAASCCIAAASAFAQDEAVPAFKKVDSIEARVQGCVTCHGQSGQGTQSGYFPRIAGKPAGYLYNQLVAFRDGTRRYPPMNYLIAYLPDAYLREIAEHFAKLKPPFAAKETQAADAATLSRGQSIVTAGDSPKGIPACAACHGARLTGMEPGIPGLVGLRPAYIVAQLTRWRVGSRHAAEPDCMKRIASRLSETDVAAVAAWLARQEAPKDAAPEAANLVRMPLACGSQR